MGVDGMTALRSKQTMYVPKADENPWRVDTWMTTAEWKEVSRWYSFSFRSLLPDGRWYEYCRSKMREKAYHTNPQSNGQYLTQVVCHTSPFHIVYRFADSYQIMRALAAANPRGFFVIVQGTLVGTDGREKAVVCFPGSESSLLRERQVRLTRDGKSKKKHMSEKRPALSWGDLNTR